MRMPGAVPAFGVCVLVSLGLHAVLLGPWPRSTQEHRGQAGSGGSRAVHARLVPKAASASARLRPSESSPARFAPIASAAPARAAGTPDPTYRPPPQPAAVEQAPLVQPSGGDPQASSNGDRGGAASRGELEGYVPRPLLSEPPVLLTPVVIEEPQSSQSPPVGMRTGVLALYIDEEGRVQSILAQEPILPQEYEQAARQAFLLARYAPGRINGQAVKARVRVEVRFNELEANAR